MIALSNIDGNRYSSFQLNHHWPQGDNNEWFHNAVTDGTIITENMGKIHDPNEPAICRIKVGDTEMVATTGDWVLRSPEGEIFTLEVADFDVMFTLESES